MARAICLRLLMHWARRAASRADCTAGSSRAIRTAMMAITTSSSIKVKPRLRIGQISKEKGSERIGTDHGSSNRISVAGRISRRREGRTGEGVGPSLAAAFSQENLATPWRRDRAAGHPPEPANGLKAPGITLAGPVTPVGHSEHAADL